MCRHCKCSKKSHCKDSIVGSYAANDTAQAGTPDEFVTNSVYVFNEDGTFSGICGAEIGSPTPKYPDGNFATYAPGIWRRVSDKHYQIVANSVLTLKNTPSNCGTALNPFPCKPNYPNDPVARLRLQGDLYLDSDCKGFQATVTITGHPLNDLSVSLPLPGYPSSTQTWVARKLTF